jgi:hypothetical protein
MGEKKTKNKKFANRSGWAHGINMVIVHEYGRLFIQN